MTDDVAAHYDRPGVAARVLDALAAAGHDVESLGTEALAGVDEFHLGGAAATREVIETMGVRSGGAYVDVGCGIGGAARRLALAGARSVVGVDLTPAFVQAAVELTAAVGLTDRCRFVLGSALALPVADGSQAGVTMLHVGMNIDDKEALAVELARVLEPNGSVAVYDIMRVGSGDLVFPLPWSPSPATSFVVPVQDYVAAFETAGLEVVRGPRDCAALALDAMAAAAATPPPPVNLGQLMGRDFPTMVANLRPLVDSGVLAPVLLVARARGRAEA